MMAKKAIPWGVGVFLLAGFLASSYTLNHFYVNGGYMLDSGWFAYLSAHSLSWPASNPPAIGGTYFSTHFSPAFYVFTALYTLLSAIGMGLSDVGWFSLTQGFWLALTASSVFALLSGRSRSTAAYACLSIVSMVVAFNGVFLASLGFPHFEIAIPALLVAFFAAHVSGYSKTAIGFLGLGLLMREDAGLHYFGLFFLLAGYEYLAGGRKLSRQVRFYSILAAACFAYSLLAIAIQKTYFSVDDNALARVYLGDPAYAHVSWSFLQERLRFVVMERAYIVAPLVLAVLLAVYKRNWGLLVGVAAVLPWILFSLLAISFQAGTLTSYYAFPVAIALFWPAIAYAMWVPKRQAGDKRPRLSVVDVSVIALSSLVFYGGNYGNHDPSPWKNFLPKWVGQGDAARTSLDAFLQANSGLNLLLDDSVASLFSATTSPAQWRYFLSFSDDDIRAADAVLFQPGAWLTGRVKEVAGVAGFRELCHLPKTRYAVLSRSGQVNNCQPVEAMAGPEVETTLEIFDYLPGWSHREPAGRWTTGPEVVLPAMRVGSQAELCFKGHAYLPTPQSAVLAEVYSGDALLGRMAYDASQPGGERCVAAPAGHAGDTGEQRVRLEVAGYSSPAAQGLSADDRQLGIFLRSIYFK